MLFTAFLVILTGWTAYVSWVDWHTRRVPFGRLGLAVFIVTAAYAVPHLVLHLRARPGAWFPYVLLFLIVLVGWRVDAVGDGDVRLWAVWWLWTPPALAWQGALATSALWVFGGLFRLLVLRWPTGQKHPAAWVVALYGLWLTVTVIFTGAVV